MVGGTDENDQQLVCLRTITCRIFRERSERERQLARFRLAPGGANLNNTRSQIGSQITAQNAKNLKLKWTFTTAGDVTATPAVSQGVVYFPDFAGNFYAVNATNGKLIWQQDRKSVV